MFLVRNHLQLFIFFLKMTIKNCKRNSFVNTIYIWGWNLNTKTEMLSLNNVLSSLAMICTSDLNFWYLISGRWHLHMQTTMTKRNLRSIIYYQDRLCPMSGKVITWKLTKQQFIKVIVNSSKNIWHFLIFYSMSY